MNIVDYQKNDRIIADCLEYFIYNSYSEKELCLKNINLKKESDLFILKICEFVSNYTTYKVTLKMSKRKYKKLCKIFKEKDLPFIRKTFLLKEEKKKFHTISYETEKLLRYSNVDFALTKIDFERIYREYYKGEN